MSTYCCEEMKTHIEAGEVAIHYSPELREYGIDYRPRYGGGIQLIRFCPWCGTHLPAPLRDQWYDELERMGIDPDGDIPIEFYDDTWWKTRLL